MNDILRTQLNRFQAAGLVVGLIGLALCAVGAFVSTAQFFISYLFGYVFWLGLALGCFAVAMIHYLTGGRWGNETRRFLEAGFMTLPLMALLFVPLFFGLNYIYPWARPELVAGNKVMQSRAPYFTFPMFTIRVIFVFAVWIAMTLLLRKWSLQQDQTKDVTPTRRMRTLSGPGMIIYPLTATMAFIDWIMSLEPDWYSTMFPVIICIGQILSAYAFAIILLNYFRKFEPMSEMILTTPFHHLGNLLLAFVVFWTYVGFGQFLIIWAGNLPHEIVWYLHRIAGGWKWIIVFLALFHFFLPFFLLLFRASKRHPAALATLAGVVFGAHIVAVFWLIIPSVYKTGIRVSWIDFAALFGVGGLWIAVFIFVLKRAALLRKMIREFITPLPMENSAHPQSSQPALHGGYEPTDVNIKGVLIFMGILVATVVIVQLVITASSHHLAHRAAQVDEQILQRAVVPSVAASRAYFPYPREQVSPQADLQAFRAREETELNSYAWIDRKAGTVRIPIDRAMDLIVQKGLPVAAGTNENKTGPSSLQLQQQRPLQFTPSGKQEKQ